MLLHELLNIIHNDQIVTIIHNDKTVNEGLAEYVRKSAPNHKVHFIRSGYRTGVVEFQTIIIHTVENDEKNEPEYFIDELKELLTKHGIDN